MKTILVRLLKKRWKGIMPMDIAFSPWIILLIAFFFMTIVMAGSVALEEFYVAAVTMDEARYASINSDQSTVEDMIYNEITKILPANKDGKSLFTTSDIQINQYDGDFVTTSVSYRILPMWYPFCEKFGISPDQLIIPYSKTYSYYREF